MYQPQQPSGTAVQVVYTASNQPVTNMASNIYESYMSQQSTIAGIILIISGVLSIVFTSIGINFLEAHTIAGDGIWCGIMFIVAGSFGIAAGRKNRCLVVAFMVLAIISASMALYLFKVSIFGHYYSRGIRIMSVLMAVMAVIAGAIAIWGSVLGCKVTYSGGQTTGTIVTSGQPVVFGQQPQQPYIAVPQVDPMIASSTPGNPPTYGGSAGYPMMSQQQPQPMTTQTGPYSSPSYNPTFAAGAPPPSTYGGGDMMPSNKM